METKQSNVEALVEASARRGAVEGAREAIAEHQRQFAGQQKRLLSISEAASYLRIHPDTLRRWIADEDVPALPVGGEWRLDIQEVKAWLTSRGMGRRGRRGGAR